MLLALTGMMGSGKSTVGALVADALGCPLLDLDREIEAREGRPIPEIFTAEGEAYFRDLEERTLRDILRRRSDSRDGAPQAVLALGGGTASIPGVAALLREKTLCIYLRAAAGTLEERLAKERDGRPMLRQAGIGELLEKREKDYLAAAAVVLDTDGLSPSEIADEIIISCL